jgi:hypothetical protein
MTDIKYRGKLHYRINCEPEVMKMRFGESSEASLPMLLTGTNSSGGCSTRILSKILTGCRR